MKSETIVGIVLVLLLLAMIQPTVCDLSLLQVFRILVVEGNAGGYSMKSGQFLIDTLLGFSNWDNSSTNYVSYIHLLSEYGQDEVMDECEPYWV